ncbi:MAG: hypothetical protein M1457_09855 [bacterium]|nr:hypothetical protein [bacterium]
MRQSSNRVRLRTGLCLAIWILWPPGLLRAADTIDAPVPGARREGTATQPVRAGEIMRLRLEGSENAGHFPILLIHLARDSKELGVVKVRFPEHIGAIDETTRRAALFYQDVRGPEWPAELACEPLRLPVQWQVADDRAGYLMTFDNGMRLAAEARVRKGAVELIYRFTNNDRAPLRRISIWSCVNFGQVPGLNDPLMARTGVPVDGRFRRFRDLIPGFTDYPTAQAGLQRFEGYAKSAWIAPRRNPRVVPHPGFPDDPARAIKFWQVPRPIDRAAIATEAVDGSWTMLTDNQAAIHAWSNPEGQCHHADSLANRCDRGQTATVRSCRIRFLAGGLGESREAE